MKRNARPTLPPYTPFTRRRRAQTIKRQKGGDTATRIPPPGIGRITLSHTFRRLPAAATTPVPCVSAAAGAGGKGPRCRRRRQKRATSTHGCTADHPFPQRAPRPDGTYSTSSRYHRSARDTAHRGCRAVVCMAASGASAHLILRNALAQAHDPAPLTAVSGAGLAGIEQEGKGRRPGCVPARKERKRAARPSHTRPSVTLCGIVS